MKKVIIYLLFILSISTLSQAQNVNQVLGDNYFNHFAYAKAIKFYKKALNKDSANTYIIKHLAQSYQHSGNFAKAEELYGILHTNNDTISMEEYAHLLIYNNKYEIADSVIAQFNLTLPNYKKQLIDSLANDEPIYDVVSAEINTKYSDFRPCFSQNKLIFTSARDTSLKEYGWNGQPYLRLFEANMYENGDLKHIKPFTEIDSRYHISSFCYVRNQHLAYFTMNNASYFNTIKDDNKEVNLGIYVAEMKNGNWKKPKPLENVSSKDYSSAHPFYSAHENRLYFSSNRPGGFGGSDIYYTEVTRYGACDPVNCGEMVNTPGDEVYPFVLPNNMLYFSSNSHPGLGGLDIFSAKIDDDIFSDVKNVGVPINSSRDDFSIIFKEDQTIGYFSSNREGGVGDDDIYFIKKIIHPQPVEKPLVVVKTEEKEDTKITLLNEEEQGDGNDQSEVVPVINTTSVTVQPAIITPVVPVITKPVANKNLTIKSMFEILDKTNIKTATSDKLKDLKNMKFRLNNVNFDFNSWEINAEAAKELDKLVTLMMKHNAMKIELSSHTDCRGNNAYNKVLSQTRADAALKYMLKQGIYLRRITAKGYGEQKLLNHCNDGIDCSEEMHRENRRVEVMITNF